MSKSADLYEKMKEQKFKEALAKAEAKYFKSNKSKGIKCFQDIKG